MGSNSRRKKRLIKQELDAMNIPRRCRIDLYVPAETAIREAIQAVESMPADARLTNAVVLLGKAKDAVADFVDGVSPSLSTERTGELCGNGYCADAKQCAFPADCQRLDRAPAKPPEGE